MDAKSELERLRQELAEERQRYEGAEHQQQEAEGQ